jgi:hypothetical protein
VAVRLTVGSSSVCGCSALCGCSAGDEQAPRAFLLRPFRHDASRARRGGRARLAGQVVLTCAAGSAGVVEQRLGAARVAQLGQ